MLVVQDVFLKKCLPGPRPGARSRWALVHMGQSPYNEKCNIKNMIKSNNKKKTKLSISKLKVSILLLNLLGLNHNRNLVVIFFSILVINM